MIPFQLNFFYITFLSNLRDVPDLNDSTFSFEKVTKPSLVIRERKEFYRSIEKCFWQAANTTGITVNLIPLFLLLLQTYDDFQMSDNFESEIITVS